MEFAASQIFITPWSSDRAGVTLPQAGAHHGLHGGAGDHELHLLSQHGRRCLLLDQVIPPVDLQLGLQVSGRVEVLAVLSRAAALRDGEGGETKQGH